MKSNAIKTTLLAATILLAALLALVGCAADETTGIANSSENSSDPNENPSSPIPKSLEPIIAGVTYKPFARAYADKFSLGDFDSPYLLRVESYTNFVASNSSILLNNVSNQVTKTDYQGNTYLGIADFSFSDYSRFISTNDTLTIIVNLVEANGTYTLSNEAIASGLLVTGATILYTWQDLQAMKHDLSGQYELMNDVIFPDRGSEGLANAGFEPVGDSSGNFTGSFAGNNHRIVNLSIDRSINYVGIWGYVDNPNSVIKDLVLEHGGIRGNSNLGGVVGWLQSGMMSNVGVVDDQETNISGVNFVGGLVGFNLGTVIGYATEDVSGFDFVGGLVGNNDQGTINGYTTGNVSGTNQIGGLAGGNAQGAVKGYATGSVSGVNRVGGLVGFNSNGGTETGYATGRVSGTGNHIGGLVGRRPAGTANGYWDQESTGQDNSAGGVGISSIANVVYDSTVDTYTDSGNSNAVVFTNAAFTNSFTLPGASAAWPTLNAAASFPQP